MNEIEIIMRCLKCKVKGIAKVIQNIETRCRCSCGYENILTIRIKNA